MKTKTVIVFRIVFIAWVFLWLFFLIRGLVKVEIKDYQNLLGKTLEEKRAYVSGKEFYNFVLFCEKVIPKNSTFSAEAKYDQSLDYFRLAYYLYPVMRDLGNPEYITCYKTKFSKSGYSVAASLTDDQYILKRNK